MQRARIIVHGLVQGVFYRAFTKKNAEELGLKGFVRNMPDGSVEIIAEGEEKSINSLVTRLRQGPSSASVQKVDVNKEEATNEFSGFEIRR